MPSGICLLSRPVPPAEAAAGPHGKVVESLGTMWLLTISDATWRPSQGTHVAAIGPLPVARGVAYTAQYMEAVLRPGMKSLVHRHSGPEAWYRSEEHTSEL